MPLRPNMEAADFMEIFRRRKWMILFSFLLILFGTTVYCVLTPDIYQSTAKLLIIPPSVAEGMVRSTADTSTRDRLAIIQQDILSRARLMAVIDEIGLSRLSRKAISAEAAVAFMRQRISVAINSTGDRDRNVNTFDLSFENEDPLIAREVASRLASFFIQENIRSREAITQETTKFLTAQLAETRRRLEAQEERIKEYKLRYGGELPQQEQANLSRLQRLQEQIKDNGDAIARLQDRKVFLESQISSLESGIQAAESQDPWDTAGGATTGPGKLYAELGAARKRLEELSQRYTAIHPAVVQARWDVEQLEAKITESRRAARSQRTGEGKSPDTSAAQGVLDPGTEKSAWARGEVQRLRQQVGTIDLEISALRREKASTQQTIAEIQRKVERLPQREQELISLTRDYDNIKKSYEELLDKKLKATISESLEEKQKGERFQILEPANLPGKPIKPDRLKVLWLAMVASLVIGAGGAVGMEILDPTLRGSGDFRSFFDLPVLASLPVIQDDRYRRKVALRRAAVVGGLVSILGAYVVFLAVHLERIKTIIQTIGGGN